MPSDRGGRAQPRAAGGLPKYRVVQLNETSLRLLGRLPQPGERLATRPFSVPPARNATSPLTRASMDDGLVLMATLPNLGRYVRAAHLLDFEKRLTGRLGEFRTVHVSTDEASIWAEFNHFHPGLAAEGYSLFDADEETVSGFGLSFGVALEGHGRIAHGLFALLNGVFVAAEVPFDQLDVTGVEPFLDRVERLLAARLPVPSDPAAVGAP